MAYDCIRPGKVWLDTKGKRIQAHGGSMFYENGFYYWYGEDKTFTRKKGKLWTWGINIYRSRDLYNWEDCGHIVEPVLDDKKSIFYPTRRMDRPHIIKNEKTGQYVLWLKYCDKAHFAVLTAPSLLGPYALVNPFLQPYGKKAGDFDLAVDQTNGEAYIYFEANHDCVLVAKLNEEYTDVAGEYQVIYSDMKPPLTREGVVHFEHDGKHYILTSGMTGYVPNPSEVAVSDNWMGPFTVLGNPHVGDDSSASFNSQACDAFQIAGTDKIIMMADRWVPEYVMTKERYDVIYRAIASNYNKSIKATMQEKIEMMKSPMMGSADTSIADYVWLPVDWEGEMPVIRWRDAWKLKIENKEKRGEANE